MPRTFTLVSISIHAVVLGGVYVAQTLTGGPLPMLRDALAFADPTVTPIRITDIPLPKPVTPSSSAAPSVSPGAAPLEAPSAVVPETGRENDVSSSRSAGPVTGVEQGLDVGASLGVLPGAASPPPEPAQREPIRPGGDIKPPRKILDVKPIYPELALATRQEGIVILETIINAQGGVDTVRVLRGYPLLNQAAIDAVRQWRFTPTLLNGQPVPVVMTVTVDFRLK